MTQPKDSKTEVSTDLTARREAVERLIMDAVVAASVEVPVTFPGRVEMRENITAHTTDAILSLLPSPMAQGEVVAWRVRTSDGFGGFLTDTYPFNGKQLVRQGYSVKPLYEDATPQADVTGLVAAKK